MILFVFGEHVGDLGHAGAAPGGPEVDEQHLAGELRLVEFGAVEQVALDLHRLAGQPEEPQLAGEALGQLLDAGIRARSHDRAKCLDRLDGRRVASGNLLESSGQLHRQPGRLEIVGVGLQEHRRPVDNGRCSAELPSGKHLLGLGHDLHPLGLHRHRLHGAVGEQGREGCHFGRGCLFTQPPERRKALELEPGGLGVEFVFGFHLGEHLVGRLNGDAGNALDVVHHLLT